MKGIVAYAAFGDCTCLRRGKLLKLRVGAVDLIDRLIQLSADDTKNGEPRTVKMTEDVFRLMPVCVRGKKDTDYVFTRADGSRVCDPREDWYALCVAAKLNTFLPSVGTARPTRSTLG
jgi:integrase